MCVNYISTYSTLYYLILSLGHKAYPLCCDRKELIACLSVMVTATVKASHCFLSYVSKEGTTLVQGIKHYGKGKLFGPGGDVLEKEGIVGPGGDVLKEEDTIGRGGKA